MSQPTYTEDLDRLATAQTLSDAPSRPPRSKVARRRATSTFLIDLAAVAAALMVLWAPDRGISRPGLIAAAVFVVGSFAVLGRYTPARRGPGPGLAQAIQIPAVAALLGTAVTVALGHEPPAGDILIVWLVVTGLVVASRGTVQAARALPSLREPQSRTLIVGAGRVGRLAAKRLVENPSLGMVPIGFLDKEPMDTDSSLMDDVDLPVLGASWDLESVIERERIETVLIAFSTAPNEVMVDLVRRCWLQQVEVSVVPRLFEVEGRRLEVTHLGALPLISLRTSDPAGPFFATKYALDRLVAAFTLLLLAPLMLLIAAAVLITSGRPILFRQLRVGRDGVPFELLKFRTMRGAPDRDGEADAVWADLILSGTGVAADGLMQGPAGDRTTRVGNYLRRFSLDELPQLWNVVRGEMSIVGPRPERAHYVERFVEAIDRYPDRHRVKSGLTGWAQVSGLRGDTSLADRIEWDNFYIENWSPWLDLKIIFKTLPAMFVRRS